MNLSAWRTYLELFRSSFRKLSVVMVVAAGQSGLFLLVAYYVRYAFDSAIPGGNALRLLGIGAIILGCIGLNIGITLWVRYVTRAITTQAICDLRRDLLLKWVSFSRAYYSEADIGRIHTQIIQHTQRLDVMSNSIVTGALPALVILVGLAGVLIYLNWRLLAIMIIAMLPLVVVNRRAKRHIEQQVAVYNEALERLSKGMLFILQHMDLIKNHSAEDLETERQTRRNDEMRQRSFRLVWADAIYAAVTNGLVGFSGVVVLVIGGLAVISKTMSLGELISFYVMVAFMRSYLGTALYSVPLVIEGNALLSSIHGLLETRDTPPYAGYRRVTFTGKIYLEDVVFGYADQPLLRNIDLAIDPGSTIALMGQNGAGKSTIANLIAGHYRPTSGRLYADDHPFDELDMVHFRKHLGIVQQDPIIFSGTIMDNLTYGQRRVAITEIETACRIATADTFIQNLPDGFDTRTGENGIQLSGGQRQKLAVARALLRQPRLLILDEPTSHLDNSSQIHLVRNLQALAHKPAILIITHELDIARLADRTYVLASNGHLSMAPHPASSD